MSILCFGHTIRLLFWRIILLLFPMASSYFVFCFLKKDSIFSSSSASSSSSPPSSSTEDESIEGVSFYKQKKDSSLSSNTSSNDDRRLNQSFSSVFPRWGVAAIQGRRESMEDRYAVKLASSHPSASLLASHEDIHLFGVFDGHGGSSTAEFVSQWLFLKILSENRKFFDFEDISTFPKSFDELSLLKKKHALTNAFRSIDEEFRDEYGDESLFQGSTGVVLMLYENNTRALVANVGDSRAVLYKNNRVELLSFDHKPHRRDEHQRIKDAGGLVGYEGVPRVYLGTPALYGQGGLAVSRAFGDNIFKDSRFVHDPSRPLVSVEPEFEEKELCPSGSSAFGEDQTQRDQQFILLASDGLWDVLSNEQACELVLNYLHEYHLAHNSFWRSQQTQDEAAQFVTQKLADHAYTLGSEDNITALLVLL